MNQIHFFSPSLALRRLQTCLLSSLCSISILAEAADTTRFLIYADNGRQIGEQVVEQTDDGVVKVRFVMKDNGRGPELNETMRFAADGALLEYRSSGNSEMGAVVDEYFVRKDGQAEWRSLSEKGQAKVQSPALYWPLDASFDMHSRAISLLKGQAGSVDLLPGGKLTQQVLQEVELRQDGKTRRVQLLAHTGIDLVPMLLWASSDPHPRMFAVLSPGDFQMIEQGWEAHAKVLEGHQRAAENRMQYEFAQGLQHKLQGLLVVRNARIFDSHKARLTAPQDVFVLRGKITAVLPAGAAAPGAKYEIDAAGKILLPGLFDMHGHVSRWSGPLDLAAGVTTVRDLGNQNQEVQQILDDTAAGKLMAPRIVLTGFLEGESAFSANNGFVIKDWAEAKHAIDWYVAHGYFQLKIYNSFPKQILPQTVAYARSRGMRVSGHVPMGLRAQEVIDMGFQEIQHINQLMLNFFATPTTETRNLNRFILPAEKVADLDFNSAAVKKLIADMKRKQIVLDPTLVTFSFMRHRGGDINPPFAAIAEHMPLNLRRSFFNGSMKIDNEAQHQRYQKSYKKMVEFVVRLHKAGVPIVAGTDDLPGFTLHAELETYVQAGMSPAAALQIATSVGAKYTGTSHERGSIEAGKLADLVLVDGNPLQNIGDLRKTMLVISQGAVYYPHEIHQALGIRPFVANPPQLRSLAAPEDSQGKRAKPAHRH